MIRNCALWFQVNSAGIIVFLILICNAYSLSFCLKPSDVGMTKREDIHTYTHTRTHARTHARAHTHTHTHTHTQSTQSTHTKHTHKACTSVKELSYDVKVKKICFFGRLLFRKSHISPLDKAQNRVYFSLSESLENRVFHRLLQFRNPCI